MFDDDFNRMCTEAVSKPSVGSAQRAAEYDQLMAQIVFSLGFQVKHLQSHLFGAVNISFREIGKQTHIPTPNLEEFDNVW